MPIAQAEPAGAASMVLMMNSVDPTRSALSTTSWTHSGCTRIWTPGIVARSSSTTAGENRPCTEQWPRHRIIRASRSCSAVSPPSGSSGFQTTQSSSERPSCSTAVLRPRCWSGRNRTLASGFWSNAHSSAVSALLEVQTVPPWRPTNALMSALEFMYVTGTTSSATPAATRASHASSTCGSRAMSAIEQPAARSGSTTCWWSAVRMSADSAMKWTPQKTTYSASGRAAVRSSRKRPRRRTRSMTMSSPS